MPDDAPIRVDNLTMAFGDRVIQRELTFDVHRGDVFIIMGGSGCGKSTLLRHLIGLHRPRRGRVLYDGEDFYAADPARQNAIRRHWGISYQGGGLFSALTLAENVALPLEQYTDLDAAGRNALVRYKLSLVGLAGFEDYLPADISGGMRKRAALARAIALDPDILFFDEPGAGLDPLSARRLDDLILQLRDALGSTVVIVTHELASIFAIGTRAVFLDAEAQTMIAEGDPRELRDHSPDARVRAFLNRGTLPESTSGASA